VTFLLIVASFVTLACVVVPLVILGCFALGWRHTPDRTPAESTAHIPRDRS
jgi:hypothetical protein